MVSFGRNEDNKAADYAELAKGQGFQPTQKMKVEPMTLKALVRERIEAGKEMPTEIFGVFSENKTIGGADGKQCSKVSSQALQMAHKLLKSQIIKENAQVYLCQP